MARIVALVVSFFAFVLGCSAQVVDNRATGAGGGDGGSGATSTTSSSTTTTTTSSTTEPNTPELVIVTSQNTCAVSEAAKAGSAEAVVYSFSVDAVGGMATFSPSKFEMVSLDGGAFFTNDSTAFFENFRLVAMHDNNCIPTLLDVIATGEEVQMTADGSLQIGFSHPIIIKGGEKLLVALVVDVAFMPPMPEEALFLDHQYQVSKLVYQEGDIQDEFGTDVPFSVVVQDGPWVGKTLTIVN